MKRIWTAVLAAITMMALILDAKTALEGAGDGIRLCLFSVIPALFPFIVISILLTGALSGGNNTLLRPLGKLCGIPAGAESLLVVGLLGGYPVGAQSVARLYGDGQMSAVDSKRMLGFCSNAGPAFIFGILASQCDDPLAGGKLWGIHILSALLVGMLLPGGTSGNVRSTRNATPSMVDAMSQSLRSMGQICGWVVLLRVALAILQKWFLWALPKEVQVILSGALELTNGCLSLAEIGSQDLRFVVASAMLSFGGVCVMMQTASVVGSLGLGMYLKGKLMQTAISILLAVISLRSGIFPVTILAVLGIFFREGKKEVEIPSRLVYNKEKPQKRGNNHAL